ncbi:MAG: class I SAM-dependent methyltransferase [Actinobacteria bacterium]|nr:class I SAM-dependent methyltransferase [Actinomycetota bacterium]
MTAGASALPDPTPTNAKDARLVQRMFDRVAPRYDLANTVLSFGYDQHWRRAAVRALAPRPADLVLDVAAGTGRLASELRESACEVVALDFSYPMIAAGIAREARTRPASVPLAWVNGDGTRLPFADATFDGVTIGFGLRNLPAPGAGLAEMRRVTRPGGRIVVLEFSTPTDPRFRALYGAFLAQGVPRLARAVASDPAAYAYLADSIRAWPDQRALAGWLTDAGWQRPQWQNLLGGVVAVHRASA